MPNYHQELLSSAIASSRIEKRENFNFLFSYNNSLLIQVIVENFLSVVPLVIPSGDQALDFQEESYQCLALLNVPADRLEGSILLPNPNMELWEIKRILESSASKAQDVKELIESLEWFLSLIRQLDSKPLLTENQCLSELLRVKEHLERRDWLKFYDLAHQAFIPTELQDNDKGEPTSKEWQWIKSVERELKKLEPKPEKSEKKPKEPPKTERLIELGLEIGEYFKGTDGESYCSIGTETFKVSSSAFKIKIYKAFYDKYSEGLTSEAWSNGRVVLEAQCDQSEPIPVYIRTAYKDSSVTIDLGNQYICIDKDEWRFESATGLKFLRPASSQVLSVPTREIEDLPTALDRLGTLVNLPPESLRLLLAWMTFTFIEGLPKPLVCFTGTHGSGKSTVSRLVKDLLDPDSLGLGTTPNDSRNLAIACQRRWLLAFDNSSGFSNEVSDSLCRVITGAGFSTRTLYSDSEETIFSFKRPILLNGIGDFINRPDLLDRSMILELDPLEERLSERQLEDAINKIKPDLLGFLLTSISKALPVFETLDNYQYDLPRMADFGLWLVALEKAWNLPNGLLLNTFNGNQTRSSEVALEASPIALAIFKLFDGGRTYWDGTTQELLDYFLNSDIFATLVKAKDFPKTVHGLGMALKRLTPDLAKQGFEIQKDRSKTSRKLIIRKLKEIESLPLRLSPLSPLENQSLKPSQNKAFQDDNLGDNLGDNLVTTSQFEQERSANQDKKGDNLVMGDNLVTTSQNGLVIDKNQSEQSLQKTGDKGDNLSDNFSISVKIKDGSSITIGSRVKLPDGSVAEVVSIESEEFIKVEGFSHVFSAYSLEVAECV